MTQEELKVHIEAINAEGDNAMATLTQLAKQAVYSKAHIAEGLAAILAILGSTPEDTRAATLEIQAGPPREQR